MKKLSRFVILSILFVLVFMLFYSFVPAIVWMFGGSFTEVSQHPFYATFMGLMIIIVTGIIFSSCFDENFYPKD